MAKITIIILIGYIQQFCTYSPRTVVRKEELLSFTKSKTFRSCSIVWEEFCGNIPYMHQEGMDSTVGYVFSEDLLNSSSKNPAIRNRSKIVHSLIESYDLLRHVKVLRSTAATYSDLRGFHSEDYCKVLRQFVQQIDSEQIDSSDEDSVEDISVDDRLSEYGLGFDCPVWSDLYNYCAEIAGSTMTACKEILAGRRIVINWFGGWHHAQRNKAAGYCYVNDIVLGILKLRQKFDRILYIDLDVHYGDGVANAFESTKSVFTLSFHQYEPGFYPGSGDVDEIGFGNAKGYSLNFPYKTGIRGELFTQYVIRLIKNVCRYFRPNAFIIQAGADCIAGDPLGNSNLVPEDIAECIRHIVSYRIPVLILGGGGYDFCNTSRLWTYLTSVLCDVELSDDIPDTNEYFLQYAPGYELSIRPTSIKDQNTTNYLDEIMEKINVILGSIFEEKK